MRVAIDACILSLLFNPNARPPTDPSTGKPLASVRDRVRHLIDEVEASRGALIVPTPVLAEILVGVGEAAPDVLAEMTRSARFHVADFDKLGAVELAIMTRELLAKRKRDEEDKPPFQKIKLDRQIVAIARVARATHVYSDDKSLRNCAKDLGLEVVHSYEMPLPSHQPGLFDPQDD